MNLSWKFIFLVIVSCDISMPRYANSLTMIKHSLEHQLSWHLKCFLVTTCIRSRSRSGDVWGQFSIKNLRRDSFSYITSSILHCVYIEILGKLDWRSLNDTLHQEQSWGDVQVKKKKWNSFTMINHTLEEKKYTTSTNLASF